jgi:hypothetical protein
VKDDGREGNNIYDDFVFFFAAAIAAACAAVGTCTMGNDEDNPPSTGKA